jgi:hypothetical protein
MATVDVTRPRPRSGKQAVVFVHGIGEQRPRDTVRGFVRTMWERDPAIARGAPIRGAPRSGAGSTRAPARSNCDASRPDHYDFTIPLVHLGDAVWRLWDDAEEEPDTLDLMRRS